MKSHNQYVMDTAAEADRLESQALISAYDVHEEFEGLPKLVRPRILDAGCGTGVVTRHLASLYPDAKVQGCDLSEARLSCAESFSSKSNKPSYFQSDLTALQAAENTYDLVVSRYVFEHLTDPLQVTRELYRVLKPGGAARIVDFDGLLVNMYPRSEELTKLLDRALGGLPVDLCVGRRIPQLLIKAGFENVKWKVVVHGFQGDELEAEKKNIFERFVGARAALEKVFESQTQARRLEKLLMNELDSPELVLFYNKFIVDAYKPKAKR